MPTIYHDVVDVKNRSNCGEGLGQIIPHVAYPDRVEVVRSLVPQMVLDVVPTQPTQPCNFLMPQVFFCMPLSIIGMLE